MSDPMTNLEIEDVLSSIRRLVAEGLPEKAAPPDVPPRPMPRLVLTPALRVDAPAGTPVQATQSPVRLGESQRVDDKAAVAAPDSPADRASLLATIAELEAAVRDQPDDWEPDGTGTDTDMSWARAGFRGNVEGADAEPAPYMPANTAAWPATLVEAARRYRASENETQAEDDKSVPVAEFRHHRTDGADQADGDGVFDDDLIGGPDLGDDPEDMLESYLAGAPIIDDAKLREMVRDIVQQELQGKLGENITRNVRKLVRREIHRALTTQTFD
ncbi:hypothetical protein ACOI1H_06700 [Loktanella sp. DJP18]|uniref:hypothetical protein n=1 Tax=Loktanella sp. DJP18 TaxID=3409788 RepID=UPI003BB5B954